MKINLKICKTTLNLKVIYVTIINNFVEILKSEKEQAGKQALIL